MIKMTLGLPRWPGWRHLPRDTRDTLFLLAVIAWTVMPHLLRLPAWCSALTVVVLLWRGLLALNGAALPARASLVTVLVIASGLTWWSERTLLGKDAGVTLLVVLMALKTLELRARRDALVVFFLGFFLVLTHFLYSQSLGVAAAMLVSVWGLLTALVLAHMPVGRPPLMQAGGLALRAALLGAPLMVALFVLFPRIGPLWGVPQEGRGHTGLSGTLRLGGVAEVANDDSIALRIRFPGGRAPGLDQLYFRGPVLTRFDGTEWRRDSASLLSLPANSWSAQQQPLQLIGPPVDYEMTLEPLHIPVLPLLEATPPLPDTGPQIDGLPLTPRVDLTWSADRLLDERLLLRARAWPRFHYGPREPVAALRDALQLPPGSNPRLQAWAEQRRREPRWADATPRQLAQMLLDHIRSERFSYTLAPGEYGREAVDEFWFDRRTGFCEHFATSFVVAMRALGVPARIVTGYQGADPQPVDGWWIVRQSYAHAWAEFWQPGEGWVRADPTAAVAPDRIQNGSFLRPNPGLVAGALGQVNPALWRDLREFWEATNNRWNQWVLNYSRTQQFKLLDQLGVESPNWVDLGRILVGLLSGVAVLGALWAWWDRRHVDPWQRLQQRIREALAPLGVEAPEHEDPRALARRARQVLGPHADALVASLEALEEIRYGRQASKRPPAGWWFGFSAAMRDAVARDAVARREATR